MKGKLCEELNRKRSCRFDVYVSFTELFCCRVVLCIDNPVISYSVFRRIYRSCGSFDVFIYDPLYMLSVSKVPLNFGGFIPVVHDLVR